MSDEKSRELIKRAQNGDQSAFANLYDSYYQHAFVAAMSVFIGDRASAEDATQEAFLKVFSKIQAGEDIEGFGRYIERAAKNEAIDMIKAKNAAKRPKESFNSFQELDSDDDGDRNIFDAERSEIQNALLKESEFLLTPEEKLEQKELQEIVREILSELPDYQQETLSLFYLEGLKQKEIAEIYGVSVDTVKSRINQGKKKVEKKVTEMEEKKGIKLRSASPMLLFFLLLRANAKAEAAYAASSGSAFVASKFAAKTAKRASESFFQKTVLIAGKEVSAKVITGLLIGAVGIGGVIGGVAAYQNATEEVAEEVTQEEIEPIVEDVIAEEESEEEASTLSNLAGRYFYAKIEGITGVGDQTIDLYVHVNADGATGKYCCYCPYVVTESDNIYTMSAGDVMYYVETGTFDGTELSDYYDVVVNMDIYSYDAFAGVTSFPCHYEDEPAYLWFNDADELVGYGFIYQLGENLKLEPDFDNPQYTYTEVTEDEMNACYDKIDAALAIIGQ